jgi:hypothetical protein
MATSAMAVASGPTTSLIRSWMLQTNAMDATPRDVLAEDQIADSEQELYPITCFPKQSLCAGDQRRRHVLRLLPGCAAAIWGNAGQPQGGRRQGYGVDRAEALRRAMLAMLETGSPREAHPAYWAPFVVVGEGAAPQCS